MVTIAAATRRSVNAASSVTTPPASTSSASRGGSVVASSCPATTGTSARPSPNSWPSAARSVTAGTAGWRLARRTLPSTAIPAGLRRVPRTVGTAAAHWPTARSKAGTSKRRKTRCKVATQGLRFRVKPSRSASGAPACGSRPHSAIASRLSQPASIAAQDRARIAGSGWRRPDAGRGSGTACKYGSNGGRAPAATGNLLTGHDSVPERIRPRRE